MSAVEPTPLPRFVAPNASVMRLTANIVDSQPVVSAYAACEWDEIGPDGQVWLGAVVREACRFATPSTESIVAINAFLTHMAERYRERLSVRFLGIRFHQVHRATAMQWALATFAMAHEGTAFGDPAYAWDRDHAHELVDEDLRHWDAA